MEERQLDFTQPLLSVRRFSSPVISSEAENKSKTNISHSLLKIPPLPVYKSELKSGPVSNPGTVPFLWEKSPGRPKDERETRKQPYEKTQIIPKLPPGRISNVNQQVPNKEIPGSKGGVTYTMLQTGRNIPSSRNISSPDKNVCEYDHLKETENAYDVYLDANDKLSRTESFFMNCSISGVSGLDGPDIRSSGTFSSDPQIRDFMMDRFLPAAKAMASEAPPHVIRKQTVTEEQSIRKVNNKIKAEYKQPALKNSYAQKVLTHYAQDMHEQESKDEDEEDDSDGSEYSSSSAKVCGLLPRFCLKSSFCLLDPVPSMRMQARPAFSVRRVRNNSSYASPCSTSQNSNNGLNEKKPINGLIDAPEKANIFGENEFDSYKRERSNFRDLLANESGSYSPVAEKTLYIDYVQKDKPADSHARNADIKVMTDYGRGVPDTTEKSSETKGTPPLDTSTRDIMEEKTMLRPNSSESVDSCFLSCSDRSTCDIKMDINSSGSDQDLIQATTKNPIPLMGQNMINTEKDDSEFQNPEKFSNQADPLVKNSVTLRGSTKFSDRETIVLESKKLTKLGILESSYGLNRYSAVLRNSKGAADGKNDLETELLTRKSNQESPQGGYSQIPLVLPSPKSPSESWLQRTLPTVSSRSSPSWSSLPGYICARSPACKISSPNHPKWESIVQTSHDYNENLRVTKEQLTAIPEA